VMAKGRWHCWLWGCWCDMNCACPKCGAHVYNDPCDYIQIGKLEWVKSCYWNCVGLLTRLSGHCDVCNKRYWWFNRYYNCCSEKCYDKWLPF
jgi:hypothetical protein